MEWLYIQTEEGTDKTTFVNLDQVTFIQETEEPGRFTIHFSGPKAIDIKGEAATRLVRALAKRSKEPIR